MKRHVQSLGIRNWYGDDFLELQGEPLKVMDQFFAQYGSYVVSGCEVEHAGTDGFIVNPGLVVLSGKDPDDKPITVVAPFHGAEAAVELPAWLVLKYHVHKDNYLDGQTKPVQWDYYAELVWSEPDDSDFILLEEDGPERFVDAVQDKYHRFVSDLEKAVWNAKETPEGAQAKADDALEQANEYADERHAEALADTKTKFEIATELTETRFQELTDYTDQKHSEALADSQSKFEDANELIEKRHEQATDYTDQKYAESKSYTDTQVGKAQQDLTNDLQTLESKVDQNHSQVLDDADAKLKEAKKYADEQVGKAKKEVNDRIDGLSDKVDENYDQISQALTESFDQAKQHADEKVTEARHDLTEAIDRLETKVDNNKSTFTSRIDTLENKVSSNYEELTASVADTLIESGKYTDKEIGVLRTDLTNNFQELVDQVNSDLTGDAQAKLKEAKAYTDTEVKKLGDSVDTKLTGKVDKINGKGLSTNDYTTADKARVTSGILTDAKAHSDSNLATAKTYSDNNLAAAKTYTDGVKTTLTTDINKKVDKDGNKVLSTNDYTAADKARVTSGILTDAKTHSDSNLATAKTYSDNNLAAAKTYTDGVKTSLTAEIDKKVDKDGNKVLSTNDYTTADKNLVNGGIASAANTYTDGKISTLQTTVNTSLNGKVDKVNGKGLSTNDFTDDYRTKLDNLDADSGNDEEINEADFDYIVDSDAKLAALNNNSSVRKVLIRKGTWSFPTTGLTLASSVELIKGYKGTTLSFKGGALSSSAVWSNLDFVIEKFTTSLFTGNSKIENCSFLFKPMGINSNYYLLSASRYRNVYIKLDWSDNTNYMYDVSVIGWGQESAINVEIDMYGAPGHGGDYRGFDGARNLIDCTVRMWNVANGSTKCCYYSCVSIKNCRAIVYTNDITAANGFDDCNNMYGCYAEIVSPLDSPGTLGRAYTSCNNVFNSEAIAVNGVGFSWCDDLRYCSSFAKEPWSGSGSTSGNPCAFNESGGWNYGITV